MTHQAYRVLLNGKCIDTVFYTKNTTETQAEAAETVRRGLIDHDGYDPDITVRVERPGKWTFLAAPAERKRMTKATTFTKQQRHAASMVRAILRGKWTSELPAWTKHSPSHTVAGSVAVLQEYADDSSTHLRAVQTAEAFMLLLLAADSTFDANAWLKLCGFRL